MEQTVDLSRCSEAEMSLFRRLNVLNTKLSEAVKEHQDLLNPHVIELSQEMDVIVVKLQQLQINSHAPVTAGNENV